MGRTRVIRKREEREDPGDDDTHVQARSQAAQLRESGDACQASSLTTAL